MKTFWKTSRWMMAPIALLCALGVGCEPPAEDYEIPETIEMDADTVDAEPRVPEVEIPDPEPEPVPSPQAQPVEPPMTPEEETTQEEPPPVS